MNEELVKLANFLKKSGAKEDADALMDKIAADMSPEEYEKYYGRPMDKEKRDAWLAAKEKKKNREEFLKAEEESSRKWSEENKGMLDLFRGPEGEELEKRLDKLEPGKHRGPLPEDAFPPQRPEDVLSPEDLQPEDDVDLYGFGDPKSYSGASLEAVLQKLSDVADKLDGIGLRKEADLVDNFMKKTAEDVMKWKEEDKKTEQSKRYDSDFHHSQQIREPKREQERTDREGIKNHHVHTYQQTNVTALSTRHCPEHVGVSLARVGELTYQCALDGKVYNWEAGWEDYDGNKHPGSSVAAQTPGATDYATPHRLFDTRENIMNLKG